MLKIVVTGAPFTGKTQLTAALSRSLKDSGFEAHVVATGTPHLPADLARQELTLLMGMEEPSSLADSAANDHWQLQQTADASIRGALAQAGIPYRVIYGTVEQRLTQALEAANRLRPGGQPRALPQNGRETTSQTRNGAKAWVWACEKCSDPACEHRLLRDLLAQRGTAA